MKLINKHPIDTSSISKFTLNYLVNHNILLLNLRSLPPSLSLSLSLIYIYIYIYIYMFVCDNTPHRPSEPRLTQIIKPNYSWPVIHLVVSDQGHYTFLYRYTKHNREGGGKEQTNKHGLGLAPSARKGSL